MTPVQSLEAARQCEHDGDLNAAERILREIVAVNGIDPDAWSQLGEIYQRQGKPAGAIASYRTAIKHSNLHLRAWLGLASALSTQKEHGEAAECFRQVLALSPDHADGLSGLALALAEQGRFGEALERFRRLVHIRPGTPEVHHNLGVTLARLRRFDEAAGCLQQALRLKPDYLECHFNLANALGELGKYREAIAHYSHALEIRPDHVDSLNNLGYALVVLGRAGEAAVYLRQAIRLRPDFANAHNNLGLALADLGRFDESEAAFEQALHIDPRVADVHTNLGSAKKERGHLADAVACYQLALWLQPDSASAHWNRSLAWLQMGDYERGWPEYEWRWRRKGFAKPSYGQPLWDGSSIVGKTVLLHTEQGLGDMIQFVRYARLVKASGGTVVVHCPRLMVPILSACDGVDHVVAHGAELPAFDFHAPFMSLPAICQTTLASVPSDVPYIAADPSLVERWRERLGTSSAFKIGIAWQGNPHHKWDHHRSFRLIEASQLGRVGSVRLISLQQVHGLDQLQSTPNSMAIELFASENDSRSFMDTAAIMRNLDLVITPDTAVAHLAGALGVPVWVALASIADWRWMFDRADTPWYPTMRLFRQTELGRWTPVFEQMVSELQATSRSL